MPDPVPPAETRAPDPSDASGLTPEQTAGLRQRLAELVLATPGVVRLDPSLRAALKHLRRPARPDGVDLVQHGRTADVDISLTTRGDRPARTVCRQIHDEVCTAVVAAGLEPGTIEISVLAVEPTP